jgi:hypothetical protein
MDGDTGATNSGVGISTQVLLTPVVPSTAPAGSALTSMNKLAMAIAINSFTLITIPSLVKQYSTPQNKKLIWGKGIFLLDKPLI